MKPLRLLSIPMCYTPGMVEWCRAAYTTGDPSLAMQMMEALGLKGQLALDVINKKYPEHLEGDDLVIELPDELAVSDYVVKRDEEYSK